MNPAKSYVGNRLDLMGYNEAEIIDLVPKIEKICMEYTIMTGGDNLEEILKAIGRKDAI